jgi:hypothetical protein
MDFNVSADPPHVVEFRNEVAAWLAEQFKGLWPPALVGFLVDARG